MGTMGPDWSRSLAGGAVTSASALAGSEAWGRSFQGRPVPHPGSSLVGGGGEAGPAEDSLGRVAGALRIHSPITAQGIRDGPRKGPA